MNRQNGRTRVVRLVVAALIILPAVFLIISNTLAAIELVYFLAETESNRVRLEWETATELDNLGFFVRRNEVGGSNPDNYTRISVIEDGSGQSVDFIPAQGDDLAGALYIYYDEDVTIGTRYYYFLEDIDTGNGSSFTGPYEVVAGQTPTPTLAASNTPSITPSKTSVSPTSTGVNPTATPSRTNTPSAGGFQPTITPSPLPGTATATPEEGSTLTDTPTPDPSLGPVQMTLTAISVELTELPTASPTTELTEVAELAPSPTNTDIGSISASPSDPPDFESGPPIGRIVLIVLTFLISGGLLTAGIIYFIRNNPEE